MLVIDRSDPSPGADTVSGGGGVGRRVNLVIQHNDSRINEHSTGVKFHKENIQFLA